MKRAIVFFRTLALVLALSVVACTAPVDPLPAVEAERVELEEAAKDTDCHNEPNRPEECSGGGGHNEPDG